MLLKAHSHAVYLTNKEDLDFAYVMEAVPLSPLSQQSEI